MILTMQILNILLAAGMAVGLVLILGVLTALRAPRLSRSTTRVEDDAATADLDDRLRRLTMASPFDLEAVPSPAPRVERPAPDMIRPALTPDSEIPTMAGARGGASRLASPADRSAPAGMPAARTIEPSIPPMDQTKRPALPGSTLERGADAPITGRPALPGSTIERGAGAQPSPQPRKELLDPLAARFSGSQRLIEPPPVAPPPMDIDPGRKRPELPGIVARDLPRPDQTFSSPDSRLPTAEPWSVPGSAPSSPSRTPDSGFSFTNPLPGGAAASSGGASRESGGRRNELPGIAAIGAKAGQPLPPALDIRAILRGEAGPLGALPPSSSFGADLVAGTLKPKLGTGPLPVLGASGPLGATPFSSGLLELRALKPDPEAGSARLNLPSAYPASERLIVNPVQSGRSAGSSEQDIDLDATRLMDDFDLPDAGFETHVFSTAELVDDGAMVSSTFTQTIPPNGEEAAGATFSIPITEYPAEPRSTPEPNPTHDAHLDPAALDDYTDFGDEDSGTMPLSGLAYLSPSQEEQVRHLIGEVAGQSDVLFVKLMAADGSVILESGAEAGDPRTNRHLAEVIAMATLEARRRDLGDLEGITVESGLGVMVLAPLHNGAVLAVLLGNPARLGMLRRQVKKPVSSLRTLLMESSV
ncbi:MAG TPA: hypothetical protein VN837_02505 [Chloroflexota bacterium]|nr:hypothetical protein [Chloroflexota bacterium]